MSALRSSVLSPRKEPARVAEARSVPGRFGARRRACTWLSRSYQRALMRKPPPPRLPRAGSADTTGEPLETPAGVRVSEVLVQPLGGQLVRASEGVLCLVVLDGVGTLDERQGTFLARPSLIAVRPAPYALKVTAGPAPLHAMLFQWPPRTIASLGPIGLGFESARTLHGRGSVELAWRAAGELRLGDPLTPHALDIMARGIAISLTRFVTYGARLAELVSPRAARARRLLDRRLHEPVDLTALAREVGCAPAYLSRLFARSFGMSPVEYVMRRRVEKARRLLAQTRQSVAEIAVALGFHDSSHFARHFRRHTGASPAEFRGRQHEVKIVPE